MLFSFIITYNCVLSYIQGYEPKTVLKRFLNLVSVVTIFKIILFFYLFSHTKQICSVKGTKFYTFLLTFYRKSL